MTPNQDRSGDGLKMDKRENGHIDDGALLALLDGELEGEALREAEEHAADCASCADRRDQLRFAARRVTAALEASDVDSPFTEMPEALREAARQAPTPIASARSARVARMSRRSIATAAGLTLVLAAGAYAIPGSPVRAWVDEGVTALAELVGGGEEAPTAPVPSAVSVAPFEGRILVSVNDPAEALQVTISLTDATRAAATALNASFTAEEGRLDVADAAGELFIMLPRDAESGSVVVGGIEVARLEAGTLVRTEAAADAPAEILIDTDG